MTVLERKARFVRAVLDDKTSEAMLSDLELLLSLISKEEEPCRYSVEELRERALQGVDDARKGKGKTIEEIRSKHLSI